MTGVIEITTDGGRQYGFGHLRRSATLAAALAEEGASVRVTCLSAEGEATLPPVPHADGDACLAVLDLPYARDDIATGAHRAGMKVAALDYPGTAPLDLAISLDERRRTAFAEREITGFRYALIRPEIAALAPAPGGQGVLVLLGGADVRGMGPGIARRLAAAGHEVTVIRGPLSDPESPEPLPGIAVLFTPENLPQRMAGCAWAVTNGGTTMLEFMCLGKPVYVVPQNEAERHFASVLENEGALLGIGDIPPTRIDTGLMRRVATRAREIVDGGGVKRVADALLALCTCWEFRE